MSAEQNLLSLSNDLHSIVEQLRSAQQRIAHLERVIRQAVMTQGGKLSVDAQHGDEAIASKAELYIGNGGVELIGRVPGTLDEFATLRKEDHPHWGSGYQLVGYCDSEELTTGQQRHMSVNMWTDIYHLGCDVTLYRKV